MRESFLPPAGVPDFAFGSGYAASCPGAKATSPWTSSCCQLLRSLLSELSSKMAGTEAAELPPPDSNSS